MRSCVSCGDLPDSAVRRDLGGVRKGNGIHGYADLDARSTRLIALLPLFESCNTSLEGELQRDRRSVEKGLNVIWQGPERDFGPSR